MPAALRRVARKLDREGVELRFCYEAGPRGYGIQRSCRRSGTNDASGSLRMCRTRQEARPSHEARYRPIRRNPRYVHTARRVIASSGGHVVYGLAKQGVQVRL